MIEEQQLKAQLATMLDILAWGSMAETWGDGTSVGRFNSSERPFLLLRTGLWEGVDFPQPCDEFVLDPEKLYPNRFGSEPVNYFQAVRAHAAQITDFYPSRRPGETVSWNGGDGWESPDGIVYSSSGDVAIHVGVFTRAFPDVKQKLVLTAKHLVKTRDGTRPFSLLHVELFDEAADVSHAVFYRATQRIRNQDELPWVQYSVAEPVTDAMLEGAGVLFGGKKPTNDILKKCHQQWWGLGQDKQVQRNQELEALRLALARNTQNVVSERCFKEYTMKPDDIIRTNRWSSEYRNPEYGVDRFEDYQIAFNYGLKDGNHPLRQTTAYSPRGDLRPLKKAMRERFPRVFEHFARRVGHAR